MSSQSMAMQPVEMPKPPLQYHERGFIMVRQETHAFCEDPTAALVFRVVESLIEMAQRRWYERAQELVKQGKPVPRMPKTWWITLTYEQILGMLNGLVDDVKTVAKRVLHFVKDGVFQRRTNPANASGAYQYTINATKVQKKIDALHKNRYPSYGYRNNQGLEPDEACFEVAEIENSIENGENRYPSYGYHVSQPVEHQEDASEGEKNAIGIRSTGGDTPPKRENRYPQDGYSIDSSNTGLRNKNGKESSSSTATTSPASLKNVSVSEPASYQQGYGGPSPLTPEGQTYYDLFCGQAHIAVPPRLVDETPAKCNTLGKYIKTQQDIKELDALARSMLPANAKNGEIYIGNHYRALNEWRRQQTKKVEQESKESAPPAPSRKQVASLLQAEAEELALVALEDGRAAGHHFEAVAVESSKTPGCWVIKVTWLSDSGESLIPYAIKTREQWDQKFAQAMDILEMKRKAKANGKAKRLV
jgi:hypothetical protein